MPERAAFRVLVTRPRPQGEALCRILQEAGYDTVHLPALEIKPLENIQKLRAQIDTLDQYTWAIFISRSAVRTSVHLIQERWPELPQTLRFASVGQGTAEALQEAGFSPVLYPSESFSSEGLLALPPLQQLANQRIALFCGEGGRAYLGNGLQERGAIVRRFESYRRLLPRQDLAGTESMLKRGEIQAVVVTSVESLMNLKQMFEGELASILKKIPLVLVSDRIMIQAKEEGFKHSFLAKTTSHESILQALNSIRTTS